MRNLGSLVRKGEAPPSSLIHSIAQEMGEPLDSAIDKINLRELSGASATKQRNGLSFEFGSELPPRFGHPNTFSVRCFMCWPPMRGSMGLNPDKAADWIKDHRKDTAMVAAQAHFMRRDLMAWKPLLADYQAPTGEGRKH